MLESLFNVVSGLKACNFIKKRVQHKCISVEFLKTPFLKNTSAGCFWEYLMNSLLIANENDEWYHLVVHIGSLILLDVFLFFLFLSFFLIFLWILLLAEVLRKVCQYLKKKTEVVRKFLNEVSRGEFLQPYLVINVTGLVQFLKILSYLTSTCLLELLAAWYVRETNTSIFISD